jgi:hypothetical protein
MRVINVLKKFIVILVCVTTLFLLSVAHYTNNGEGFKRDYLENERFWNDIRDISFSKLKELNARSIFIDRSYHIGLHGIGYRLWIEEKPLPKPPKYYGNLTDIFTEEEAEKIEDVFNRKVHSINFGYTIQGANTLVFYGNNFLNSHNAIIYSNDDREFSSSEGRKIIPINKQWYFLHSK